jgi:hypothetical protein
VIASIQLFAKANITYMNHKLFNMTATPITPSPHKEQHMLIMLIIKTQSGISLITGAEIKAEEGMMSRAGHEMLDSREKDLSEGSGPHWEGSVFDGDSFLIKHIGF